MKKYIFISVLLFLTGCSLSVLSGKNFDAKNSSNQNEKETVSKLENSFDGILLKILKEERLSQEEEKKYNENSEKILSLITKASEVSDECMREGREKDSSFSDIHLSDSPAFYMDPGVKGFKNNYNLLQAINVYQNCVSNKADEINKPLFDKFIYNSLFSRYTINKAIYSIKKAYKTVCSASELNNDEQKYCNELDENFVIDSAKSAYEASYLDKDKNITDQKIKDDLENFINTGNLIKNLE